MKTANFLSGGQSLSDASGRLNAMNKLKTAKDPWNLSFSWSAALQVSHCYIVYIVYAAPLLVATCHAHTHTLTHHSHITHTHTRTHT